MDFKELVSDLGITLTAAELEKFQLYYEYLVEMNQVMNLTAITKEDEVYIKHFYDSLTLASQVELKETKKLTLCDVGSGAGFPSIPLAICFPNLEVTIIDALQKRINFLNNLINKLNLNNVRALHYRAEDYAKEARESFDIVTARAVARLNVLAELCLPLTKVGGQFVALKGDDKEELIEADYAIKKLGAKKAKEFFTKLPLEMGNRTIIIYNKESQTPKSYPRSFAAIKKNPLRG